MAADILKRHVPLTDVIKLIMYSLPFIIAQSAPFATLVGFLMCLGRLVSDNEILLLRASGQSFSIILIPVLILGMLISVSSFLVNDYLLPLGTISYNKLYRNILVSNPGIELESNSIKRTQDSILVIGNVEDKSVSDLLLFDSDDKGNQRVIISSGADIFAPKDPAVVMQLQMEDAMVIYFDKKDDTTYDYLYTDKMYMNLFSKNLSNSSFSVSPNEMTSYDLYKKIQTMKKNENTSEYKINSYVLEFNKKFALPFGSIFFALLAMPLAILFGKHNGQTIGLIIGVIICVLYWAMQILGQTFGYRNGFNGFWAMWIPNIVVAVFGVFFYMRLLRR
jgi:lipopolysaccharide export system permease protein